MNRKYFKFLQSEIEVNNFLIIAEMKLFIELRRPRNETLLPSINTKNYRGREQRHVPTVEIKLSNTDFAETKQLFFILKSITIRTQGKNLCHKYATN
jgi:hypothetical protein